MQQEKKLELLKKHYREYFKDSFPAERLEKVVDQALCIKEETEAIFNAMEEYAAAQHRGTSGWVKASDRLPGWGRYVKWRHESGKELPGRESVQSMTDRDHASLHGWEWYDESESPSKEGNKDREALANDAVEFAGWILENNIEATFNDKGKLWVDYRLPRGENKFISEQLYEQFKNRNNG